MAVEAAVDAEHDMLASLTAAINSDLDLRRTLQSVTDIATELSRAQFGAFFYNGLDDRGELYQLHVLSGAGLETFAAMPAPRITTLFEPTFSGDATVRIGDVLEDPRFHGTPPGHLPARSYLAVPVVTRTGDVIGALQFGHAEPNRFDARTERIIEIVAAHAAVAVENARLFAAEQAARLAAEQATKWLSLLQSLTDRLASALSVEAALDAVADTLAGPMDVHRVFFFLRDGDGFRAAVGQDLTTGSTQARSAFVSDDLPNPMTDALSTDRPVWVRCSAEFAAAYPELSRSVSHLPGAGLVLPLTSSSADLGALSLTWAGPREFEPAELEMWAAAAGQLGSTVERARLFEAEQDARDELSKSIHAATETSRALQRALLPRSLPVVDGLDVVVRYQASSVHVEVGGDWYDTVPTSDGAIFVIGDVQGHNLAAAAVMGQLRIALHAYLAEGHPIAVAVSRANALLRELSPRMIATCCVIRVDTVANQIHVVRAGHPKPLLGRPDGSVHEIDAAVGVPLGVLTRTEWPVTTVDVRAGDRIVLFTDGLVERRDADIDHGVAVLRSVVAKAAGGPPTAAADEIIRTLGNEVGDDIALLVCDLASDEVEWRSKVLTVPADPRSVAHARTFTRDLLGTWQLGHLEDAATLIVSELVTNVLRHTAATNAVLELRLMGGRLGILVGDNDETPPRTDTAPDAGSFSGRGLMLVRAVADDWGIVPRGPGKIVWAELRCAG